MRIFQPAYLLRKNLLCNLCLLGDDEGHDQVYQRDPAKTGEESKDDQQTDDRGIDSQIFAQACTASCDHAVGGAACQFLVVCIHDMLLSNNF
jgi:hypothetical protein